MSNHHAPQNLRCEYTVNPLGIDVREPRLSWEVNDNRRGAVQSAYQILVAENIEYLEQGEALTWNSGKVASEQSTQVTYADIPLKAGKRYYWKVRTWDSDDKPSEYSEPAYWEMGLLESDDWTASWISAPATPTPELLPMGKWIWYPNPTSKRPTCFFQKEFIIADNTEIVNAHIQVAADTVHILHVNNDQVGAMDGAVLVDYNISDRLHTGSNVILIEARQFTETPGLLVGGMIKLFNGQTIELQSDASWTVSEKDETSTLTIHAQEIASYGDQPWGQIGVKPDPFHPAPLFRKEFSLNAGIKSARAYICGLGYYELYLNGSRIGDHVLDLGQTDYDKRAFYVTYDITELLNSGNNAVGVHLGDGFYNQTVVWGGMSYGDPKLILQIVVDYTDGSSQTISSDNSWKTTDGPVVKNNVYAGETYDARREIPDWAEVGLDDTAWSAVRVVDSPTQKLVAQDIPPIKRMKTIKPVAITNPKPGVYIYDMGQNFAGWCRLTVDAPAGTTISLRSTEILDADGMIEPCTTGVYHTHWIQTDTYICKGSGVEVWEPRFTYHGFRYVEMTGFPGTPSLDNLEGVVVHTSVENTGTFECSDQMINRIHDAAIWTEISNLHSVATDCPHREKCGWLGDAHISGEMTIYNFNMAKFWSKYMRDINTTMVDGMPSMIAPGKRLCGSASVDWGTAIIQVPWYIYLYYGDKRILEEQYPYWRNWIDHVRKLAGDDLIVTGKGWDVSLGDWCPPGGNDFMECPPELTSTAFFYFDARIAAQVANILGFTSDAEEHSNLADSIKKAFIERYYDTQQNTYGSQTADAITLYLDLIPDNKAAAISASLARDITEKHDGGFTTGIMGLRHLFGALADHGNEDVAYQVLTRTAFPSIGFTFNLGATTLWEIFSENPVNPKPDYSLNHPMQGGFDTWFYNGIAGINPDPSNPGFKHIILRPTMTNVLEWARASYKSIHGEIISEWCNQTGNFRWRIKIPANTTATIHIPCADPTQITESGRSIADLNGVEFIRIDNNHSVYNLKAGDYDFKIG